MRGFLAFGLSGLLIGPAASASEARSYSIDLKYDPVSRQVTATALIALKPETGAKTVTFYLHDELAIASVRIGGKAVPFDHTIVPYDYSYDTKASRVVVQTKGRDLSSGLAVTYEGRFSPSSARSPSDYMRGDGDGLYLRSYAYSLWFPVFAESNASFPAVDFDTVKITAPAAFRAVFVGEETSRSEKNGLATATWTAKAIGPYDAQLTLGRYGVKRSGAVAAYHLKDAASQAAADRIIDYTDKLLADYRTHYRQTAAERPLLMVEEPKYGDIASANMVGLSDANWRAIKPDGYEIITLAHELVHAFVQTPTAKSDPLYVFQLEGFPSYFHLPALASFLGEGWYDTFLDTTEKRYLERRATGKDGNDALPPEKPILAIAPDEVGTYKDTFVLNDRALLFWDYLHRKMTPAAFDALVRELTAAPDVSAKSFFALIARHAPALQSDAHRWLETTDYPNEFRRNF
jgi:hypothetical protein